MANVWSECAGDDEDVPGEPNFDLAWVIWHEWYYP